jgi:hypothetical protein
MLHDPAPHASYARLPTAGSSRHISLPLPHAAYVLGSTSATTGPSHARTRHAHGMTWGPAHLTDHVQPLVARKVILILDGGVGALCAGAGNM